MTDLSKCPILKQILEAVHELFLKQDMIHPDPKMAVEEAVRRQLHEARTSEEVAVTALGELRDANFLWTIRDGAWNNFRGFAFHVLENVAHEQLRQDLAFQSILRWKTTAAAVNPPRRTF